MSKLAHSDERSMRHIEERARMAEGEDVFTSEDDYVTRANIRWHFQAGPGSLVQTPDGKLWTVVSFDLTGYGVIEGDQPQYIGADNEQLVPYTHLLREPYDRKPLPDEPQRIGFLGELVRVIREVKPDGTVEDRKLEILGSVG